MRPNGLMRTSAFTYPGTAKDLLAEVPARENKNGVFGEDEISLQPHTPYGGWRTLMLFKGAGSDHGHASRAQRNGAQEKPACSGRDVRKRGQGTGPSLGRPSEKSGRMVECLPVF